MASLPSGIILVLETSERILAPGRWPPMPGFCTLSHFNFNGAGNVKISFVHAKTSGSYLDDGIFSIGIKNLRLDRLLRSARLSASARPVPDIHGHFC